MSRAGSTPGNIMNSELHGQVHKSFYERILKRILDVILTVPALIALAPLFLVVAVLIKLEDSGSVFYGQKRVGRNGKTIDILKFRSMSYRLTRIPGEAGELVGANDEITNIGRWIRRLKIDELPQLFSVVTGDMSIIGPRPCLPENVSEFDVNGHKRLLVRPGCSGLAQVYGNIYLPWKERWKYDAYYVDHISLLLDMKILLRTVYLIIVDEKKLVVPYETFISNIKSKTGRG
jgi:lipopolysaccharide/colanic/teichoic acid biosynthesis glycosyltransferase